MFLSIMLYVSNELELIDLLNNLLPCISNNSKKPSIAFNTLNEYSTIVGWIFTLESDGFSNQFKLPKQK